MARFFDAIKGREPIVCAACASELADLERELAALRADIKAMGSLERSLRYPEALRQTLLRYIEALLAAMARLRGISHSLSEETGDYRRTGSNAPSRFQRDKVEYDYAIRELETLGSKLSRLFSSY